MPNTRKYRPFTEKQKIALQNRQSSQTEVFNPMAAPGTGPLNLESRPDLSEKRIERLLNDYLLAYDARLIEIDHKYPLGSSKRPEWLEVHRKNGVKRLKEITQAKRESGVL